MAIGNSIKNTSANMRFVVDLYDGSANHYYFSDHSFIDSAGVIVSGRVIEINDLIIQILEEEIQTPVLEFLLADTDNYVDGLSVDGSWEIYLRIGTKDIAISTYNSVKFRLIKPPQKYEGQIHFVCQLYVNSGWINDVRMDQAECDSAGFFSKIKNRSLSYYRGEHIAENGAIELTVADEKFLKYLIGHAPTSDNWDGNEDYIDFFMQISDDNDNIQQFKKPSTDGYSWRVESEAITPDFFPTSTNVKFIQLYDSNSTVPTEYVGMINHHIDKLWVNLRGFQASGSAEYDTPANIVKCLFDSIITDDDSNAVGTDAYNEVSNAITYMDNDGIMGSLELSGYKTTASLLIDILLNTGLGVYYDLSGKLSFYYFQNSDSSDVTDGYSDFDLYTDYNHAIEIEKADIELVNSLRIATPYNELVQRLDDEVAQSTGFVFINEIDIQASKGSALQSGWRYIQFRRDVTEARQWLVTLPHIGFDIEVSDIIRFSERLTSLVAGPCYVKSVTYNITNYTVTVLLKDLASHTSTNAMILLDESLAVRTRTPGEDATVSTANQYVYWDGSSGDTHTIAVDDIFECWDNDNQYSAKVTAAPTWTGSQWRMTVASVAQTTGTIDYDKWDVKKSYITSSSSEQASSGFLSDTDNEFTNNDTGKKLVT